MFYLIAVIICYFIILIVHKYLLNILKKKIDYKFSVLEENENFEQKKDKKDKKDKKEEKEENDISYASDKEEEELIQLSQDELNNELNNYIENIDEGEIKESNVFNTEYSLDDTPAKPLDSFYDTVNKEKYEIQENNWVPSNENIMNGGEIFNGIQGFSNDNIFSNFDSVN